MSRGNVEIGREMVDAFDRRDVDALVPLVRPDVEWDDTEGWLGIRGVYRGPAGVREWADAALEVWERLHAEVEEITEGSGGRVFLGASGTFRGGARGAETEARAWYVLWLVHGKIARWKLFWARDEALEATGLSE
jgi:ketosteroid isomerase-like protein